MTSVLLWRCQNPTCQSGDFRSRRAYSGHLTHHETCRTYAANLGNTNQNYASLDGQVTLNRDDLAEEASLRSTDSSIDNLYGDPDAHSDDNTSILHSPGSTSNDLGNQARTCRIPHLPYTNSRRVEVDLLRTLEEMQTPLYAYQRIMQWASDAHDTGYTFRPKAETRGGLISELQTSLHMKNMRPMHKKITLKGETVETTIVCFDFTANLLSILSDTTINRLENLAVNPNDVFGKYLSPDDLLGELNSGRWYDKAYKHCILIPGEDFLCPIILYIDKTALALGGLSVFPVMMSTSILNVETRNRAMAWRPLGYISGPQTLSGVQKNKGGKGLSQIHLHQALEVIFETFIAAQKPNALDGIEIRLGDKVKRVNLKVPLATIIGDAQGHDQLCGRFCHYGIGVKRLCRTCDVPPREASNPHFKCKRIKMSEIFALIEANDGRALDAISQHNYRSAFADICFGGDEFGLFSACCTEMLHALESGMVAYSLSILYNEMTDTELVELDKLVQYFTKLARQNGTSSRSRFPRFWFKDGVTSLSNVTANTKVGMMFAIVLAALTEEGRDFLVTKLGSSKRYLDLVEAFQLLLSFWAWMKRPTYWKRKDKKAKLRAREKIKTMMSKMNTLWPRTDGQGWDITKFHELLHIPDDLHRFGAHQNVHSGPQEHNHIELSKNPAQRTQKRQKTLHEQVGERVCDHYIVETAYAKINRTYDMVNDSDDDSANLLESTKNGSSFTVRGDATNGGVTVKWGTRKDTLQYLLDPVLADYLWKTYFLKQEDPDFVLECTTTYKRGDKVFRAHPNYQSEGPWYDWVKVEWSDNDSSDGSEDTSGSSIDSSITPARLYCFVKNLEGGLEAIIHSCENRKEHSVFTHEWGMEHYRHKKQIKGPVLRNISVHALEGHTMILPILRDNNTRMMEVLTLEEWGNQF